MPVPFSLGPYFALEILAERLLTKGKVMTYLVARPLCQQFSTTVRCPHLCTVKRIVIAVACMALGTLNSPFGASADEYAVYPLNNVYVSYAFGKEYNVRVTKEMVDRAPQWLEKSENPPLSARKALQAANRLADGLLGKRPGFQRYLGDGICLKPAVAVGCGLFDLTGFGRRGRQPEFQIISSS